MSKFRLYLRMGARGVLRNRQLYLPFTLAALARGRGKAG